MPRIRLSARLASASGSAHAASSDPPKSPTAISAASIRLFARSTALMPPARERVDDGRSLRRQHGARREPDVAGRVGGTPPRAPFVGREICDLLPGDELKRVRRRRRRDGPCCRLSDLEQRPEASTGRVMQAIPKRNDPWRTSVHVTTL